MPGRGIDFVLPSDYDKLAVARQRELAYINEKLRLIQGLTLVCEIPEREKEISDLREWINNHRVCYRPGGNG